MSAIARIASWFKGAEVNDGQPTAEEQRRVNNRIKIGPHGPTGFTGSHNIILEPSGRMGPNFYAASRNTMLGPTELISYHR